MYVKVRIDEELKVKETKLPVEIVVYEALWQYPAIQKKLRRAFGISER